MPNPAQTSPSKAPEKSPIQPNHQSQASGERPQKNGTQAPKIRLKNPASKSGFGIEDRSTNPMYQSRPLGPRIPLRYAAPMSRHTISAKTATSVTIGSRTLLAFVGTDYLGLSGHPDVQNAVAVGIKTYGVSASASRATSGTTEAHQHLEEALAEFLGLESALVLASGELANAALMESLRGEVDRILIDADAHPSLVHAAQLNGAPRHDFGPGDPTRLLALCDRFRDQKIAVLTDGVYPSKGRIAPLDHILRFLPTEAILLLDDSHSFGVLRKHGRGTMEAFGTPSSQVVTSFSLSKALGASGGALVGPADRIEAVRRRSEVYQGGTALAPGFALGALAALNILQSEPERTLCLHRNISLLHRMADALGHRPQGSFLPVWNLSFDDPKQARRWHAELLREGIYVPANEYLGGPDQAIISLRFSVTSEHSREDLARLQEVLEACQKD